MICMLLVSAILSAAPAVEFYVSPSGKDTNAGTRAAPFATLARARDAIRQRRDRGAATVLVRGGTYCLDEPLKFGPEDSGTADAPVVYRAYPGETPVLVGGRPITGFVPHRGQILKADVGAQGFRGVYFRQLLFDGERQHLARYPNFDAKRPVDGGWAYADGQLVSMYQDIPGESKRLLRCKEADLRPWARPEEAEVLIFPRHNWWNNLVPVASVDREQRLITLAADCSYAIRPGDRYYVRNLLEELDAPGEWYLDRETWTLYFWPPAPLEGKPVYAAKVPSILQLETGAAHLQFRGFTLECCESSGVAMSGAENCLVADCTIGNLGGYGGSGVAITGGKGSGVTGCFIHDVGRDGVSLGGGDQKTRTPAGNFAEGNHITRVGVFYKQGAGVMLSGVGNRVARNWIHHVPRWCVGFAGNDHLIELNHLHHASLETEDTGAVYGTSLDWRSGHGIVIRHNHIHDVIGFGRHRDTGEWTSPYFSWGIYLDWSAAGVKVIGNIITRVPRAGIMLHDGRDNLVEGNIVVDCGEQQIELSGWDTNTGWWVREIAHWTEHYDSVKDVPAWQGTTLRDPRTAPLPDGRTMRDNTLRRNILVYANPNARAFLFRNVPYEHNPCDENLVWAGGKPIRTDAMRVKESVGPDRAPNGGFEEGTAGQPPARWSWHIRPSEADQAVLTDETPRAGKLCLRLQGVPDPANADKASWARVPSFKTADIPAEPGKVYRMTAWLRADRPGFSAELGAQAYQANVYHWNQAQTVAVGTEWVQREFAFRFPGPGQPGAHPQMRSFYLRLRLPGTEGTLWADDVQLHEAVAMDEWESWQALGMDRRSLVADPLFVAPERDDYRLRPESPAWKLGFEAIPVERIGPPAPVPGEAGRGAGR